MKYKRRKENNGAHIRCDFEKPQSVKQKSRLRRFVISAILLSSVYTATRSGIVERSHIQNIISTDSPFVGKKITEFVESTAKEVSSAYTGRPEKKKPDNVHAKIASDATVASDAVNTYTLFKALNPCAGRLSSDFGERVHPVSGNVKAHNGIDIAAPEGNAVMACADGVVKFAGYNSSSGNYVIIDHGNGYTSSYAHMLKTLRKTGDSVKRGDVIGKVGSTGVSTGPHLHFEIRINDEAVNPRDYIEG